MSNVIDGKFGNNKKQTSNLPEEKVVVDEVAVIAVEPESQFYLFEAPLIGSYGVVTQHIVQDNNVIVIIRGKHGPDMGIPLAFLCQLLEKSTTINIGDLVCFGQLPDDSIGPIGIRRITSIATKLV